MPDGWQRIWSAGRNVIARPESRKHCRSPKCVDYLSRSSLPEAAMSSARSRQRTCISPGKFAFPMAVLQQLLLAPLQHFTLLVSLFFGPRATRSILRARSPFTSFSSGSYPSRSSFSFPKPSYRGSSSQIIPSFALRKSWSFAPINNGILANWASLSRSQCA